MSKIINVYQNPGQNLENTYNIHVDKLNELPNYSLPNIILSCFNYLKEDDLSLVLEELIRKLSFGGKLIIKTLDFKSLCFSYMNNALEDQKLFTLIDGIKNLSSFNFIEKILSKNPDIRLEKIDIDQNFKIITLERIKL
jgi:hypothetical protein